MARSTIKEGTVSMKARLALAFMLASLGGCAGTAPAVKPPAVPAVELEPEPVVAPIARGDEYVVIHALEDDTLQSLAARYLGDAEKSWLIADFNNIKQIAPGQQVVIPLVHPNPIGVYLNGYQTVPILCYHRFGNGRDKMVVSGEAFAAQMAYLREHDYHVVPLSRLVGFLKGESPLPRRTVVITIDDGYRSTYDIAFPILQRLGFPATVFLYTDFVGAPDAMGWSEMQKMVASGLIDVQPHSKSHARLIDQQPGESMQGYQKRIAEEIKVSSQYIRQRLRIPTYSFAYPYGASNQMIIGELKKENFQIGATVRAGANPAFAYPFRLRRTMIYGDQNMDAFVRSLQVFRPITLQ